MWKVQYFCPRNIESFHLQARKTDVAKREMVLYETLKSSPNSLTIGPL